MEDNCVLYFVTERKIDLNIYFESTGVLISL